MQRSTALFYAVTSFFLGLIAIATGGAHVLALAFGQPTPGDEPFRSLLLALTVASPVVFLVLGLRYRRD